MTQPDRPTVDPFIDEVRRLKREASERTPTRDELIRRLREIEQERAERMEAPRKSTDAA